MSTSSKSSEAFSVSSSSSSSVSSVSSVSSSSSSEASSEASSESWSNQPYKKQKILKDSGLTDLQIEIHRFHNTPELERTNIKAIDDKIHGQLTGWIYNFDCVYTFDEHLTDKIVVLVKQLDNVVGYACLNFYEKGVITQFDQHFPTIKLSMEQYKFKDKDFTIELFEYIYQYFDCEFLLETDYPEIGEEWRTKMKCLPITDLFYEGVGYYVYPTPPKYNNLFTINHDYDIDHDDENTTMCPCSDCLSDRQVSAMEFITKTMYPGYADNKLIEWEY